MKVILLSDVKKVGKKGQIVEVSDGYGANFLIPNKLAVKATKTSMDIKKKQDDDQAKKEAEKLIKKGADPRKILITGDDSGDETINPTDFVIESEPFARACGAIELANKIKSNPYFKRAKELNNLIIIL